jgi:hypothetical protein
VGAKNKQRQIQQQIPYGMTDEKQAEADTTATATACGEILEARDETVSGAH